MEKNRKISLTMPVVIHSRIRNEKFDKLSKKMFLVEKILYRLPQKIQEKIFTEDYTVNERIFEKGFCFMQIGKFSSRIEKILDVGCCWSSLPIELASLGFKVWGIDTSEYFLNHPNFTFMNGDVCSAPFSDCFFDLVTAISTVEHIGLGHYQDPEMADGDFRAAAEIQRILKPKGLFILTLPYGEPMITPVFRIYDEKRLTRLTKYFQVLEAKYWINYRDLYWKPASRQEVEKQGINERGHNAGNVTLLLEKID
jgi:SAM-dependent methyltransferase